MSARIMRPGRDRAMAAGMPNTGLRDAILTRPTFSEGQTVLFSAVPHRS